MATDDLISVIMPARNCQDHIGDAIESVLKQTYENLELIIIDDASTDHTEAVVRSFNDKRIILLKRFCKDRGIPRNDGLKIARGTFIALSDADDISVPERFAKQLCFFRSHPEIDIMGGRVQQFGDVQRVPTVFLGDTSRSYREKLLRSWNILVNPTVMFRAHVLGKISHFMPYDCGEDYDFWLRASRYFRISNIDEILVYKRVHRNNITRRKLLLGKINLRRSLYREFQWLKSHKDYPMRSEDLSIIKRYFLFELLHSIKFILFQRI